jgi:hypothetical protein
MSSDGFIERGMGFLAGRDGGIKSREPSLNLDAISRRQ